MKKSVLILINIILVVLMVAVLFIQSATKTDIAKGFDGNCEPREKRTRY